MKIRLMSRWIVSALLLCSSAAVAAAPEFISYQGRLNDQGGSPVSGTISFTFALYNLPTGGAPLWTETQSVLVSNGIFNVQLGASTPLPTNVLLVQDALYLGLRAAADQEMTPRQKLTSGALSQVEGEQIAREGVWPVHEGRNNTIRSYRAEYSGMTFTSFQMPVDKIFIITDISTHSLLLATAFMPLFCQIQYVEGSVTTILYKSRAWNNSANSTSFAAHGVHESFKAGLPVPAGALLQIGPSASVNPMDAECIVAGFEIPAAP